ncbi:GNAT family N-acetyltransferase [Aliikangiella sp. IMCC44359]|uniref:GNAT family N-acetyltransferase n=1 Tax=Aliikangiella sp. IMCC44359 TaxID=3459125 RepID=UPI00403AD529
MIEIITQLNQDELKSAMNIRRDVFVYEQGIPEESDFDGEDEGAEHVLITVNNEAAATGRVIISKAEAQISRIAVIAKYRSMGLGRKVVESLEAIAQKKGAKRFELHPHVYLQKFYEELGYQKTGGSSQIAKHELITMIKLEHGEI